MTAHGKSFALVATLALGCLIGAAATLLVVAPSPAEAQSKGTPSTRVETTYAARFLEGVMTTSASDKIEQVHSFPGSPVFLVRTKKNINVWERRGDKLVKLLDVVLDGDYEQIVFLDDHKTFVVHTPVSARIYSLDVKKKVVPQ